MWRRERGAAILDMVMMMCFFFLLLLREAAAAAVGGGGELEEEGGVDREVREKALELAWRRLQIFCVKIFNASLRLATMYLFSELSSLTSEWNTYRVLLIEESSFRELEAGTKTALEQNSELPRKGRRNAAAKKGMLLQLSPGLEERGASFSLFLSFSLSLVVAACESRVVTQWKQR